MLLARWVSVSERDAADDATPPCKGRNMKTTTQTCPRSLALHMHGAIKTPRYESLVDRDDLESWGNSIADTSLSPEDILIRAEEGLGMEENDYLGEATIEELEAAEMRLSFFIAKESELVQYVKDLGLDDEDEEIILGMHDELDDIIDVPIEKYRKSKKTTSWKQTTRHEKQYKRRAA